MPKHDAVGLAIRRLPRFECLAIAAVVLGANAALAQGAVAATRESRDAIATNGLRGARGPGPLAESYHRPIGRLATSTRSNSRVEATLQETPRSAGGLLWGVRGHTVIDLVSIRTLPADGPRFLAGQEEWVAYQAIIPDLWRRPSEPFLKISEDPNHHWYRERITFMHRIPRSRYEFVLAVHDEHRRLLAAGDTSAATMTNVHWTGTLPYAAVENYERMVPAMRRYREALTAGADTHFIELEIASYLARLGHYIGDGAQPLHVTIHSNGWLGGNPEGYATDAQIHGRFESRFVNGFGLEPSDVIGMVTAPRLLDDPFDAVLAHLDSAARHVEEVYRLDKTGALADFSNREARALVLDRVAHAASLLRDLVYTAWVRSGEPVPAGEAESPISPLNPRYNPATGSAPAARRPRADR